jgi:hypothetical protein
VGIDPKLNRILFSALLIVLVFVCFRLVYEVCNPRFSYLPGGPATGRVVSSKGLCGDFNGLRESVDRAPGKAAAKIREQASKRDCPPPWRDEKLQSFRLKIPHDGGWLSMDGERAGEDFTVRWSAARDDMGAYLDRPTWLDALGPATAKVPFDTVNALLTATHGGTCETHLPQPAFLHGPQSGDVTLVTEGRTEIEVDLVEGMQGWVSRITAADFAGREEGAVHAAAAQLRDAAFVAGPPEGRQWVRTKAPPPPPPPPPRPHAPSITDLQVRPLEETASTRKTLRRYMGRLRSCHDRAFEAGRTLGGRVALGLKVDGEGVTRDVTVLDATTSDTELIECFRHEVSRIRFVPAPEGGFEIDRLEFKLRPPSPPTEDKPGVL